MKQQTALLSLTLCLAAVPLLAQQPTIGGGSCSSATVNGTYAVMVTGRGVSPGLLGGPRADIVQGAPNAAAGNLSKVFQATGTVTFDGQSKATFALKADTGSAANSSLPWSGTYSVQANCMGTITVNSNGSATLNLMVYAGGGTFLLTGSDSSYTYSGNGNTIATGCSTATMTGVYVITATQGYYGVTPTSAGGAATLSGLAQFDGGGNVVATGTISANGLLLGVTASGGSTFSGTYSLGSNCVGQATIKNTQIGTVTVNFSVYTGSATLSSQAFFSEASATSTLMITGNLFYVYPGSTLATAGALLLPPAPKLLNRRYSNPVGEGERS